MKKLTLFVIGAFCMLSARAASLTLAWDPSPSSTISGYALYYYGAGNVTNRLSVGNLTKTTVGSLQEGKSYSFYVVGVYAAGMETFPSNMLTYNVPSATNSPSSIPPVGLNLMTNSSFEQKLIGWTASGALGIYQGWNGCKAPFGSNIVIFNLNNNRNTGKLIQKVNVSGGYSYTLSLSAAAASRLNRNTQKLQVIIDGRTNLTNTTIALAATKSNCPIWSTLTFPFRADTNVITVTIRDASQTTSSIDLLLDNVQAWRAN